MNEYTCRTDVEGGKEGYELSERLNSAREGIHKNTCQPYSMGALSYREKGKCILNDTVEHRLIKGDDREHSATDEEQRPRRDSSLAHLHQGAQLLRLFAVSEAIRRNATVSRHF